MDRLIVVKIAIFLATAAIIFRLFYWQFIANSDILKNNVVSEDELPAPRGEIYTRDGFPLVTNQEAFLLFAKPQELSQKVDEIAKILSPYLISEKHATAEAQLSQEQEKQKQSEIEKKQEELIQKLTSRHLFWVQLARKVPLELKEKIQNENVTGLGFERDDKRFYPEASMAAHLLGFVASNKFGQDTGYFGLEGYYDRQLRGRAGRIGSQIDPFGFPILVGKYRSIPPKKGSALYLTLDRTVQFIIENRLQKAVGKYGARGGTVVVADPNTGHILAMATYPAYNPALFYEEKESAYKNPAIASTYEPGSTFKLITASSALDLGVIEPDTKCPICSGPRQIGGFEISTWNKKYYPDSTMTEVIEHSDNIGATFIAEKLGLSKFYSYIRKFGFAKTTGIDLQEETAGLVRDKDQWRQIDLLTASFGQGIAVTPIQMVQAVSAIANGGRLISPKVVAKISDGRREEITKSEQTQVLSPKTAAQVTEIMVNAVEMGEAKAFKPKGYRIAGKTGTAQIPVSGHYDPHKTIASFIGFAPANDPKFVMLVSFSEPSSSPFGSETAAPTFFAIASDLFNYYGIAPTND